MNRQRDCLYLILIFVAGCTAKTVNYNKAAPNSIEVRFQDGSPVDWETLSPSTLPTVKRGLPLVLTGVITYPNKENFSALIAEIRTGSDPLSGTVMGSGASQPEKSPDGEWVYNINVNGPADNGKYTIFVKGADPDSYVAKGILQVRDSP